MMDKRTVLLSAFPGTGKSHFFRETDKKVLDSDSSTFDKKDFPANYIKHIKENLGKVDVILISSHKEVRDALVEAGLHFNLVYPEIELKDDYISRYEERGSDEKFIDLISNNWDDWISEMEDQSNAKHIRLGKGKFISDLF